MRHVKYTIQYEHLHFFQRARNEAFFDVRLCVCVLINFFHVAFCWPENEPEHRAGSNLIM